MGLVKVAFLDMIHLYVVGAVTVADNKWRVQVPYGGEILKYGGWIQTLGTGAGTSTEVQVRNVSTTPDKDYFTVAPTFEVDSATKLLEGGTLIASPTFRANDLLALDIDAISTGPADMDIWLLCQFFREVDV